MRSAKEAILVTGLFAALVVVVLAWYVSMLPKTAPAPETPSATGTPAAEEGTPPESGRLMAPPGEGLALYTDSEHDFLLHYPSGITPLTSSAEMTSLGYIPTCDPDHAVVCFPYDPMEHVDTNFESAAFSVHLRDDIETEAECLAPQPAESASGAVAIGGTVFSSFQFGDAAMSHRLEGRNYRAWYGNDCYELATRIATSVFEVWEAGSIREFTANDELAVRMVLEAMLKSFRFQADLELL
jgi:hypothetical protein